MGALGPHSVHIFTSCPQDRLTSVTIYHLEPGCLAGKMAMRTVIQRTHPNLRVENILEFR